MAVSPGMVAKLIEVVRADLYRWTQNADGKGEAICDGCAWRRRVVYSSRLQWCESCWPLAAPHDQSTQTKDWASKRAGQERDYGWSPA